MGSSSWPKGLSTIKRFPTLVLSKAATRRGPRDLTRIGVGECHMLIVNDEHRLRAGIKSLSKRCSYCSKPLKEYPLIMNDDAGFHVFHAACAAALAIDIQVDLCTFFNPPAPYHQFFVLTTGEAERTAGQGGRCAINGSCRHQG